MVTKERLMEILTYEESSGLFVWKVSRGKKIQAGNIAGSLNNAGYHRIRIDGRDYLTHRLAWLYSYGHFPKDQIDHINRIKTDNRLCNLREATTKQNNENKNLRADNKTGATGVYKGKVHGWCAYVYHHGKQIHLGTYPTKELAEQARNTKAKELFTHL